jgi:hypothetical protein
MAGQEMLISEKGVYPKKKRPDFSTSDIELIKL